MFTRPMWRRRTTSVPLLALVVVTAVLSTAPASKTYAVALASAPFPATVHAANGAVTVPTRPMAIVSLSPTATEMLYAIGAGSQVKAVDQDSDYPSSAPRTGLDGNDPNVEAIAADKPDLVILSDEPPSVDSQLGALGVAVLSTPAASNLGQEYAEFMQLGVLTGHEVQARAEVARIKRQIAQVVASVHRSPRSATTYYYELDQTYYSATSSTFIGQVLGLLGLRSIADGATGSAASGGYPQLSGEYILKSNPSYILLADTLCCGQSPATVAARPGWANLSAVKHGRVLKLNDDIASRWGPRIVLLLSEVAAEMKAHPAS